MARRALDITSLIGLMHMVTLRVIFLTKEMSVLWELLEEITAKKNWYEKVFDPIIVNKWREEAGNTPNFRLAISLLQSTAKGSRRAKDSKNTYKCEWPECNTDCIDCRETYGLEMGDELEFDEWCEKNCVHKLCSCIPPEGNLYNYIEHPSIDKSLFIECLEQVNLMIQQETPDWHPGSNKSVLDIIHPSLYCYVRPNEPETDAYQWLPSEFEVDIQGKTTITSYVNNLNSDNYPSFVPTLERLFSVYLPSLEKVVGKPLKGRTLQVIVKVASTVLTSDNPSFEGGSWHIEGMPYENIVGTALAYLDIDGITDSFLEFRKPVIINELEIDYPQNNGRFTEHHYGIAKGDHHDGHMNRYLGLIKCGAGNSVVFPNSLQHRVKEFRLEDGRTHSTRTILCFFLVDPDVRIVSTKDVPPQQDVTPRAVAEKNREMLMYYRKYFVDELNEEVFERKFSLCEH